MMLSEHLETNGVTQAAFAAEVEATQSTISKICAGIIVPKRRLMARIVSATGGTVTPNDLCGVDIPAATIGGLRMTFSMKSGISQ